jgi:hypothetical protein
VTRTTVRSSSSKRLNTGRKTDPGTLHRHMRHPQLAQPLAEGEQIVRHGSEGPHVLAHPALRFREQHTRDDGLPAKMWRAGSGDRVRDESDGIAQLLEMPDMASDLALRIVRLEGVRPQFVVGNAVTQDTIDNEHQIVHSRH